VKPLPWIFAVGIAPLAAALAWGQPVLKLATTTSTQNSGILEDLLPRFEAANGIKVHVIAVGTGKAIQLGEQGDVDLVMAHAPELELPAVERGSFVDRTPIMFNDFVLLGPPEDPAGVRQAPNVAEAMRRIAGGSAPFISRADRSGTHAKELALWEAAGIKPAGAGYQVVGQGMGATLRIAHERRAYTLSDDGTYFAFQSQLDLAILSQREPILTNPYAVMAVNPQKFPHVDHGRALALIRWLSSPEGQKPIGAFVRNGHQLFTPGVPAEISTAR